ncbi:MAG: hypothetical protein WDO19_16410 [Bacteroidota bacterium]
MKTTFFRYLIGCVPLIALFGSAYAQNGDFSFSSTKASSRKFVFKEAKAEQGLNDINIADINARALREFSKTFKAGVKATWREIEDGFMATFKEDGIETRVDYDRKGRWAATIRTYSEANLPRDIRHLVKSTYYDYSIFLINEVTVGDKTAYLIRMEDADSFKTIRVADGEMDVYEEYKKG